MHQDSSTPTQYDPSSKLRTAASPRFGGDCRSTFNCPASVPNVETNTRGEQNEIINPALAVLRTSLGGLSLNSASRISANWQ